MNPKIIEETINHSPFLVFSISKEGVLETLMGAETTHLGLDSSLIGNRNIFKNPNFPCKRSYFKRALGGAQFSATFNIDNTIYETTLTPVAAESGEISVLGLSMNVTKRIELEQSLDDERFRATAAQRLNSLAGIANGIAHEINNPLAIISGYSEQLRDVVNAKDLDSKRIETICQKIEKTCERCAQIIQHLQDFSRDAQGDPFSAKSIKNIISQTVSLCAGRFEAAGINIILPSLQENIEIECREVQISQALFNILVNAHDALANRDNPWVRIEIHETSDSIVVSVTDNGPGIPESIQHKILEPFFTTKEVGRGTGVGLSTAKGIIDSHHGDLRLAKGTENTTFLIELPKKHG